MFVTFVAAGRSLTTTVPHHLGRPFEILAPQATSLAHNPLDDSIERVFPDPMKVVSEYN
jgi:hypothetical protein